MNPSATDHQSLWQRAVQVMPGGVNSPVRAFGSVGGTPRFMSQGEGAYLQDQEGRRYLDFMNSWGPLILGHAHPEVVQAVQQSAALGTSFGASCEVELQLAEAVTRLSPVADMVRFVSSGTEATMSALRLARAATGRDAFLKFDGCYHGHGDSFLVKAGSGLATFGTSSSAGVPEAVAGLTGVLPLADETSLKTWFQANGERTAAVFVEGIPANCGLLPQARSWWQCLTELCRQAGCLLIVDEVITGFRLSEGGFCQRENIEADLVTYGKVIGGGLPVGAYGGRRDLMEQVAPTGSVYQAGTLSGNPVAMSAGLATLQAMQATDVETGRNGWQQLEHLGSHWQSLLEPLLKREKDAGRPLTLVREGSLFWLCFETENAPKAFHEIPAEGAQRYAQFFHALCERGVMFAPSAYEVGFLSTAMTEADLEFAANALGEALEISR
ncbi:MAG: glutamate-1-semialdehyde 2,1-aminomutase [Planctomycetota bacterium]|nr:MAG: glutamate-1-semialdehyde 2,1-aminomutase [Planctomycetota bacterium]